MFRLFCNKVDKIALAVSSNGIIATLLTLLYANEMYANEMYANEMYANEMYANEMYANHKTCKRTHIPASSPPATEET
jgi:hypothetical protein